MAVGLQSVAVSSCGNFGIAGAQSGRIDKYNLQSGLHRGGIDGRTRRAAVCLARKIRKTLSFD